MAQKVLSLSFNGTISAATDATISSAGNYNSTIQTRYLNLPKLLAKIDRKNYRHFDNKGFLLNYAISIHQVGPGYRTKYSAAPNTWVTKNAGRKWHAARMADFAKMGIGVKDLGEYNRTIRPYLDATHASGTEITLMDHDNDAITGGEWTYTQVAAPAGLNSDGAFDSTSGLQGDKYFLTLAGIHGGSATSNNRDTYTHVSMAQSYLQSRRTRDESIGSADPGEHTVQDPSPLLEFMQDSAAGGMKTDLLEDMQDEGAPYPGHLGGVDLLLLGETETTTTYRRDGTILNVPGGLLKIQSQQNGDWLGYGGSGASIGPRFVCEVIGITKAEG